MVGSKRNAKFKRVAGIEVSQQEDEEKEMNSATYEISQPGNFQAQKLLSKPTATPAKTKREKLEDLLKREKKC